MNRKHGIILTVLLLAICSLLIVRLTAIFPFEHHKKEKAKKIIKKNNELPIFSPRNYHGKEQIKYVIDYYFKTRYEGQKKLTFYAFDSLTAKSIPETTVWLNNEKEKRQIELYLAKKYNLSYNSYSYNLDFGKFHYMLKGQKVVVYLKENHEVTFSSLAPIVSKMANREHIISLRKQNGIWKISFDQYENEFSQLLKDYNKEQIISFIERNKNYVDTLSYLKKLPPDRKSDKIQVYDRNKAANYADSYWENYNSKFDFFEDNDCTNFASQVIYAGGAPMDFSGQHQWFYRKNRRPSHDYSFSWAVVQDLYYYLTKNSWTGPIGEKTDFYNLQKGDIVQFYSKSKGWLHSVVVVAVPPENERKNLNKYLVNAHDSDRFHYPLSYFGAHKKRYIHIQGWYK